MGQKNGRARIWAKRGTRPRLPADQRYTNAYLFGAICPRSGKGAALMLPFANTRAMQMHLDEISCNVAAKAHGVVLMDRAGWHSTGKLKVPKNLTIILLPSRSPELNPVENIWQYLRQNWLSNRVFEDYHAIIEAGCQAWNKLSLADLGWNPVSPSNCRYPRKLVPAFSWLCRRRSVDTLVPEQCPGDTGCLIGHGDQHHVCRPPRQEPVGPARPRARLGAAPAQHGSRTGTCQRL